MGFFPRSVAVPGAGGGQQRGLTLAAEGTHLCCFSTARFSVQQVLRSCDCTENQRPGAGQERYAEPRLIRKVGRPLAPGRTVCPPRGCAGGMRVTLGLPLCLRPLRVSVHLGGRRGQSVWESTARVSAPLFSPAAGPQPAAARVLCKAPLYPLQCPGHLVHKCPL